MNKEQVQGKYEQFSAEVRRQWNKLTNDDIGVLKADRDKFFGILKEKHGIAKEEAEKQLKRFEDSCGYCSSDKAA